MHNELFHFELFGQTITLYMYGLMIAVGVIAALAVFWWLCRYFKVPDKTYNFYSGLALAAIGIGFFGAWAFQQIYEIIKYGAAYQVTGNITFMGGLVFGVMTFVLGAVIFAKPLPKNDFYRMASFAAPAIAVAHAFGRLGCFFAGCCYGIHSDPPLGLLFPEGGSRGYVLPTMLYESIFLFLLFGVLMLLILRYKKANLSLVVYGLSYSVWRFLLEFIRGDESRAVNGILSPSQWQSIILFLVAALLGFFVIVLKKIPLYNPLFAEGSPDPYDDTDAFYDTEQTLTPEALAIQKAARAAKAEKELIKRISKLETLESMTVLAKRIQWLFFLSLAVAAILALTGIIMVLVPVPDATPLGAVFLLVALTLGAVALLDCFMTPRAAILYDPEKQELYIDKRCAVSVSPPLHADESLYYVIHISALRGVHAERKPKNEYIPDGERAKKLLGWLGYLATAKVNAVVLQTETNDISVHNVLDFSAVGKIAALKNPKPVVTKAETEIADETQDAEPTETENEAPKLPENQTEQAFDADAEPTDGDTPPNAPDN